MDKQLKMDIGKMDIGTCKVGAAASLIATVLLTAALPLSAQAAPAPGLTKDVSQLAPVAQKGPSSAPAQEETATPYATVPGGNSGGLVFAVLSDLMPLAAEVGSARMEVDDEGQDYIAGTIDGINYALDVYNCDPDCADLTFTASFEMDGVNNDMMNEWNSSRRFGKAYIRSDGDAVLQIAINTRYGITVETFRDDLIWWETVLEDYVDFIGFR